jgi:hypothetical protein
MNGIEKIEREILELAQKESERFPVNIKTDEQSRSYNKKLGD